MKASTIIYAIAVVILLAIGGGIEVGLVGLAWVGICFIYMHATDEYDDGLGRPHIHLD